MVRKNSCLLLFLETKATFLHFLKPQNIKLTFRKAATIPILETRMFVFDRRFHFFSNFSFY